MQVKDCEDNTIWLKIKPSAKRLKIEIKENGIIRMDIPEKAEKGKANVYIINFFKKAGIEARIIRGSKSQTKLIKTNKKKEEVLNIIKKIRKEL